MLYLESWDSKGKGSSEKSKLKLYFSSTFSNLVICKAYFSHQVVTINDHDIENKYNKILF